MMERDKVAIDSIRRDVDRGVMDLLLEQGGLVTIIKWWELLKLDNDMTCREVRHGGGSC